MAPIYLNEWGEKIQRTFCLPHFCKLLDVLYEYLNTQRYTELCVLYEKHLKSFEMLCWRRMEKISWTDHVRNEEVLLIVSEQRNILHEIIKR
jgi:hypothetical protein